ncbi:hypothetical protein ACIGCM_03000 [Pseudomonas sp. NPDC078700]|uniref:hypothetical protein n=1 Tax=Pseudomonas sp. NPDC078700 TaxID=3364424 RepID=UPI0037C7D09C
MSLLARDTLIGVVTTSSVALFVRQGRNLLALESMDVQPVAGKPAEWPDALSALQLLLHVHSRKRAQLTLLISNQFTRFCLVPWSEHISTPQELEAYALICFEDIYGQLDEGWSLRLSPEPAGQARLAAAMTNVLFDQLHSMVAHEGMRLTSVQPYLMAAFNYFRPALGKDDFVFIVAEPQRCNVIQAQAGRWVSIRSVTSDDSDASLSALIAREHELKVLDQQAFDSVYLHAPARNHKPPRPICGVTIQALTLPVEEGKREDPLLTMAMAAN